MDLAFPQKKFGNDLVQISLDSSQLAITRQQIASELGYAGDEIPDFFAETIDEILNTYSCFCDIKAGYRILPVDPSTTQNDGIFLGGQFLSLQKIIAAQIRKSEKVAAFTCTIGSKMESWATRLFEENDALKGHFVDTVASVAVERATDILHDTIGDRMRENDLSITNRFSPGYCGWPVSEQHVLFSMFPKDFCGIRLTQSALMLPRKSTSGIIGIGASVKREPHFCEHCAREDCTYRSYLLLKKTN